MPVANWKTEAYNVIQSLLFNNRHRVIRYHVRDAEGNWTDRATVPAPARRLYETDTTPERTCLETIQFVHHMLIPPGGRHVAELHVHPDAEELVVVTQGTGKATVGNESFAVETGDVVHVPTGSEHELSNNGSELLGVLFINVPTGRALRELLERQETWIQE